MLAAVVRSGVVEAIHEGAAAIVAADGSLLAHSGDIDRRFLGRSSFKPFQAQVGLEQGSDLDGAHLAITCASHPATPAHVAFVQDVLDRSGLSEADLQTPPSYPSTAAALHYVGPHDPPRPIWHNCSGKHAGMLVACLASGYDLGSYTSPDHPLQKTIAETIDDVTGEDHGPPAVDGCGAPAFRCSTLGMARAFSRLAREGRYERVRAAMTAHPRLVGDPSWVDVNAMVWVNAVAKGGAEGVAGVGLDGGVGIAVKAWDGSQRGVYAAVVEILRVLGRIDAATADRVLEPVAGGGNTVGTVEPRLDLHWA